MGAEEFRRELETARRDVGSLLFHWTRRTEERSAFEVLMEVLSAEALRGSSTYIKGGAKCVCFSEAPITEAAAMFRVMQSHALPRYEPYGIAVRKKWLFARGARPVIYEPLAEADQLPEGLRWRHVSYDPTKTHMDFTWEREWRIQTDNLKLDRRACLVIVPTADEAFHVMTHAASGTDGPEWLATAMNFFGLAG